MLQCSDMWYVQRAAAAAARRAITGAAGRGARAPRAPVTPASWASRPARAPASARPRRPRPGCSPPSPSTNPNYPFYHHCEFSRASRGDPTSWTSYCTQDTQIVFHPYVSVSVAAVHLSEWIVSHRITSYIQTASRRCASGDELLGGTFYHKLFRSRVYDNCVYFSSLDVPPQDRASLLLDS